MQKIRTVARSARQKFFTIIDARPFGSFIALLVVLFVLVVAGRVFNTPQTTEKEVAQQARTVSVYSQGTVPSITMTAEIEKTGVITIVAQTSGVVQKVPVTEGTRVKRGTTLVSLSSSYQGGNAATVSRQIAQRTAQFNAETYDTQKELLAKQKEVANKQDVLASDLRNISQASIDGTKSLISLNEDIISTIDRQIKDLEATNVAGSNDSAILAAKQGKAGALSALNSLRAGLRSTEYSVGTDSVPAQLDTMMKDMTLKQIDIQEKSLELSKDLSALQVKLARVTEALFYPTTPCPGVVERVLVSVGDTVSPGTPIAVIRADAQESTAVVKIPAELAAQISRIEPSTFAVGSESFSVVPRYVSQEPTSGTLHTALYSIPEAYVDQLTNGSVVPVTVPIGESHIQSEVFIPLDAVYQSQDAAYVYVALTESDGTVRARVKPVVLGAVTGTYVVVTEGIDSTDMIIVTRGVSDGDPLKIE